MARIDKAINENHKKNKEILIELRSLVANYPNMKFSKILKPLNIKDYV